MRGPVIEKILEQKLIAIVRGMPAERIVPLARALCEGGITLIEVTFNQAQPGSFAETAGAIAAIREACGEAACVGAGTVMNPEQLHMACDAGARFIISPNADPDIIRETRALGLVSMPGCMTATECALAHRHGADFVKLFPAGRLGADYLRDLRAPLSHIRFLAVGGITPQKIPEFLRAGALGFGVGGSLVNPGLAAAGKYGEITAIAREYVRATNCEHT